MLEEDADIDEPGDRLAHGDARDAELAREVAFAGQRLAGLQLAGENLILNQPLKLEIKRRRAHLVERAVGHVCAGQVQHDRQNSGAGLPGGATPMARQARETRSPSPSTPM